MTVRSGKLQIDLSTSSASARIRIFLSNQKNTPEGCLYAFLVNWNRWMYIYMFPLLVSSLCTDHQPHETIIWMCCNSSIVGSAVLSICPLLLVPLFFSSVEECSSGSLYGLLHDILEFTHLELLSILIQLKSG